MALPEWNSCGLETWHYLFVLYNPPSFFPLPLLFGISVCTGRGRGTECFCGTVAASFGLQWEQQAHRGANRSSPCIVPAGGALLRNSWAQEVSKCFPSCARAGIQPPWWLWSITAVFFSDRVGSERRSTLKPEGDGLPGHASTHSGRLPSSSLSHFMSTQLIQSVIQTLHSVVSVPCKCSQLAKFSATCRSHPHWYQLQRGWTSSARGQSQLWLVLLACGADRSSLNRLLGFVSTYAGMHIKIFLL